MAKLPNWLKHERFDVAGGVPVLTFSIRYWHPYVWWLLLRALWARLRTGH